MRKEFEMGNTDSAATWDAYKARVYCHDATPAGGRCVYELHSVGHALIGDSTPIARSNRTSILYI